MKGADVDVRRSRAEHRREPTAECRGRGGRKGNGEDACWRNLALANKIPNAAGECRGLSTARTCENTKRTFPGFDHVPLLRREASPIHCLDQAGRVRIASSPRFALRSG